MPVPDFSPGEVWTAQAADSIGLWLVKTQTVGTGVSSVTVTDAFSADYDNYLITYRGDTAGVGEVLRLQLGSTTTGYYGNLIYANYLGGTPASVGDSNDNNFTHVGGGTSGVTAMSVKVFSPFETRETYISTDMYVDAGNAGSYRGILDNTTSYTAFTIIAVSAITGGTIRVYGMRN